MEGMEYRQNPVLDKLFSPGFKPVECKSKKLPNMRDYVGIPFGGRNSDGNPNKDDDAEKLRSCGKHRTEQISLSKLHMISEYKKLINLGMYSVLTFDDGTRKQQTEVDINGNIIEEAGAVNDSAEDSVNLDIEVEQVVDNVPTQEAVLLPEIIKVESLSEVSFELIGSQEVDISKLETVTSDIGIPAETEDSVNDQVSRLLNYKFMRNSTNEDLIYSYDICNTEVKVEIDEDSVNEKNVFTEQSCVEAINPDSINTSNSEIEVYIDVDCIPENNEKSVERKDKLFSPNSAYGTEYPNQQCSDNLIDKQEDTGIKSVDETVDKSNDVEKKRMDSLQDKEKKKTNKKKDKNVNTKTRDAVLKEFENKSNGINKFLSENTKTHAKQLKPKHNGNIVKSDGESKQKHTGKDKGADETKRPRKNRNLEVNVCKEKTSETDVASLSTCKLPRDGENSNSESVKLDLKKEQSKRKDTAKEARERSTASKVLNKLAIGLDNYTNEKDSCKTKAKINTKAKSKVPDKVEEKCVTVPTCQTDGVNDTDKDKGRYTELHHDRDQTKSDSPENELTILQKDQEGKGRINTNIENTYKRDRKVRHDGDSVSVSEKLQQGKKKIKDSKDTQCINTESKETVSELGKTKSMSESDIVIETEMNGRESNSAVERKTKNVKQVPGLESISLGLTRKNAEGSVDNKLKTKKCSETGEASVHPVKEKTLKEHHKKHNNSSDIKKKHSSDRRENCQIPSSDGIVCSENSLSECKPDSYKRIKQKSGEDKDKSLSKNKNVNTNTDDNKRNTSNVNNDIDKMDTERRKRNEIKQKKRKLSDTVLIERTAKKRVLDWLERQVNENIGNKVESRLKPSVSQMKFKIPKRAKDSVNSKEMHRCSYCKNVKFKSKDLLQSHVVREHKSKTEDRQRNDTQMRRLSCPDYISEGKDTAKNSENNPHFHSESNNSNKTEHSNKRRDQIHRRKKSPENERDKSKDEIQKHESKTSSSSSSKLNKHYNERVKTFHCDISKENQNDLHEHKSRSKNRHRENHAISDLKRGPNDCKTKEMSVTKILDKNEKGMQNSKISKKALDNETNSSPTKALVLENEGKRLHEITELQSDLVHDTYNSNQSEYTEKNKFDKEFKDSKANTTDICATTIPKHKLMIDDIQTVSESAKQDLKDETENFKRKHVDKTEKENDKEDTKQNDAKRFKAKEINVNPAKNTVTEKEVNNETKAKVTQTKDDSIAKTSIHSFRRIHMCEICEKAYFSSESKLLQHKSEKHYEGNDKHSISKALGSNTANSELRHQSDSRLNSSYQCRLLSEKEEIKSELNVKTQQSDSMTSNDSNKKPEIVKPKSISTDAMKHNESKLNTVMSLDLQQTTKIPNYVKQNLIAERRKGATTERCNMCNKVFFVGSIERHIRFAHPGETKHISAEHGHETRMNATTEVTNKVDTASNQRESQRDSEVKVNIVNLPRGTSNKWGNGTNNFSKPQDRRFFQRNNPHRPQERQFFQRQSSHENEDREGFDNNLIVSTETCISAQSFAARFPWQCRKCKQRFAKKHLLKRHIRSAGHFKLY